MRADAIANLLPGVIRRAARPGSPLAALLSVMEELHAPSERALAALDATCDPWRAAPEFLRFLLAWVGLSELPLAAGSPQLRAVIASAAQLHRRRGTRGGLVSRLECASGIGGFALDEAVLDARGRVRPFHVRVRAPARARAVAPLLEAVIAQEKPAHITCELVFE